MAESKFLYTATIQLHCEVLHLTPITAGCTILAAVHQVHDDHGANPLSRTPLATPYLQLVVVGVLLYVHRNRRLIMDRSPARPPRLSTQLLSSNNYSLRGLRPISLSVQ